MADIKTNKERELAKQFVLNTRKNVFLTGKAGTGKTTLLKEILEATNKNHIVAAPTGVAAINAGGITLHSLLTIPLRAFIPYRDKGHSQELFFDGREMVKHQKFNQKKLQLLLELELLVIDEISMVRADIFDAIDQTLRRVRKIHQPFGGVQLLVIGDLFQLSPVVKSNVQEVLSLYYKSPYFFDSLVWKESESVIIELKTVYRQEEEEFIDILNGIRSGAVDDTIVNRLNANYADNADYGNIITLTTHNNKADRINQSELDSLDTESKTLTAEVSGRFYENSYPAEENIQLKVGAKVMFIRNHSEGLYFNGKIGEITEFDETNLKVKGDDGITIIVEPAEWKNMVYEVNPESGDIEQKEVGSYIQYPLRLAWAVTVHKSQGLTFDNLILDLQDTFASGQLYVALSRCRSLSGLTLTSKVSASNVITDHRVTTFTADNPLADNIEEILKEEITHYDHYKFQQKFSINKIVALIEDLQFNVAEGEMDDKANRLVFLKEMSMAAAKLGAVVLTFQDHLDTFFKDQTIDESYILKRCVDGIDYFVKEIHDKLLIPSIKHAANYAIKSGEKAYTNALEEIEYACWRRIETLYSLQLNSKKVYLENRTYVKKGGLIQKKKVKGETYNITYEMIKDGKSVGIIAKERGLAVGTIEGHFAKLISSQRITIFDVMKEKKVNKGLAIIKKYPDLDLTELMKKMTFKVSFGELRCIQNHFRLSEEGV